VLLWSAAAEGFRRRDGVVTRVRTIAAVSLMTPVAAAAIAVGSSGAAYAADVCAPLASASITPPSGSVTAGSSVHVSAQINGVMLLKAHLQISGPGLDKQVGKSVLSGGIQGDVTVPKAGYFTLAVIGDGTKCTYKTAGFSVKDRPVAPKASQHSSPSASSSASGSRGGASAGLPLPPGGGGAGGGDYGLTPLNSASPFSLPTVVPNGTGLGFEYPSPDPQVASPPSRPAAHKVSQTTPIKWGPSLALALVLLIISAHLGMWSRRQRLAAEGARVDREDKRTASKKAREDAALATRPSTLDGSGTLTDTDAATGRTESDSAQDGLGGSASARDGLGGPASARDGSAPARDGLDGSAPARDGLGGSARTRDGFGAPGGAPVSPRGARGTAGRPSEALGEPDGPASSNSADGTSGESGRGYRGRRRRT
jgi:hypothetical protein